MSKARIHTTLEISVDVSFTIEAFESAKQLQEFIKEYLEQISHDVTVHVSGCDQIEVTNIEYDGYTFEEEEED